VLQPSAIAGILKCTVHSPGGGIANGHCSVSYGSRSPTCPPARQLPCCLLRHLRLKSASSPSLAPPFFVTPSLGAAAITGVLKCTANLPGGGIANGHCSLSHGYMATLACAVLNLLSRTANNKIVNHVHPYREQIPNKWTGSICMEPIYLLFVLCFGWQNIIVWDSSVCIENDCF
jgi:hypothetical protein